MAHAFIGTSGWNYKHWRGDIYPNGLAQRRWLEFFAPEFDTVELNTSFYAIPKPASVAAWVSATPPGFRFSVKMWRGITHYRKLRGAADFTRKFLDTMEVLPQNRRAPLLLQLPPGQPKDLSRLEDYIYEFRTLAPTDWRLAVEFRNASWRDEEVRRMLDRTGVALCLHDMLGRADCREPNHVPFIYVRRHGSAGGRYAGGYSAEAIAGDAQDIARWLAEGRDVYVYYNNDIGGHAFHNARDLRAEFVQLPDTAAASV